MHGSQIITEDRENEVEHLNNIEYLKHTDNTHRSHLVTTMKASCIFSDAFYPTIRG